jgi:nucleoside-diphosphate-sugar epimerase
MILVTGGTGLLGGHLLIELTRNSTAVRAIYRDQNRLNQLEKLFQFYYGTHWKENFDRIEWLEGDILDIPSLERAMESVDTVYHCAALVSFAKRDFFTLMKVNREGTANVVNVALYRGVKTLCYVSSTTAIGGQSDTITSEDTKWKQSPKTSGYSISKYSAEKEVWRGVEEGLDCVIVNPCLIFGPGNWEESSLTIFRTIEKGLRFYTSGKNAGVDARDVAEIMVKLTNSEIRNERFLCIGENLAFKDLLTEVATQLGKKPPTINTPKWLLGLAWRISGITAWLRGTKPTVTRESAHNAFSVMHYDASKIKERLNFTFRPLKETIENTIKGRIV